MKSSLPETCAARAKGAHWRPRWAWGVALRFPKEGPLQLSDEEVVTKGRGETNPGLMGSLKLE